MNRRRMETGVWRRAASIASVGFALIWAGGCKDANSGPESGAATEARAAAPLDPAARRDAISSAEEYLRVNRIAEADTILKTLIQRTPDDTEVLELLARVELVRADDADDAGLTDLARDARQRAWSHYEVITGQPNVDAALLQSAGTVAMAAGEEAAALVAFTRAANQDVSAVLPRLYAAQVARGMGRIDDASAWVDAGLAIDPDEPMLHATRALLRADAERCDEAFAAIQRAREIDATSAGLRLIEARVLRDCGRSQDAVERLLAVAPAERFESGLDLELVRAWRDVAGDADVAVDVKSRAQQAILDIHADRWQRTSPGRKRAEIACDAAEAAHVIGDSDAAWQWIGRARQDVPGLHRIRDVEEMIRESGLDRNGEQRMSGIRHISRGTNRGAGHLREAAILPRAQFEGKTLVDYAPEHELTNQFMSLADELDARLDKFEGRTSS